MIKLLKSGKYKLEETQRAKILTLDHYSYAWILLPIIGEVLEPDQKTNRKGFYLASGNYRLYEVKDEPEFTASKHLELFVGDGLWQGYLLPAPLPRQSQQRTRIIATAETISKKTIS